MVTLRLKATGGSRGDESQAKEFQRVCSQDICITCKGCQLLQLHLVHAAIFPEMEVKSSQVKGCVMCDVPVRAKFEVAVTNGRKCGVPYKMGHSAVRVIPYENKIWDFDR